MFHVDGEWSPLSAWKDPLVRQGLRGAVMAWERPRPFGPSLEVSWH